MAPTFPLHLGPQHHQVINLDGFIHGETSLPTQVEGDSHVIFFQGDLLKII